MDNSRKDDFNLGMRLCETRENLHYTQSQFAETLGIDVTQYKRIERGESRITVDKLRTLYKKYQIRQDFLLLGEESGADEMKYIFVNATKEQRQEMIAYLCAYIQRVASK